MEKTVIKEILKIAAGVALGNKMSDINKNDKKDLFGTAVCQRCFADPTEMKRFTCMGCPASKRCTQKTK